MDLADINSARNLIAPYIRRTPLEHSRSLTQKLGREVYVKYELFQRTGSFKIRGAFNKMLKLSPDERARGVVAVSGGNHAQAVASAAATLGVEAVILMAENTPQSYVSATNGYGAEIELLSSIAEAFKRVDDHVAVGKTFIHPFDDPEIMAGAGTVGVEILEDLSDATHVMVSIGGGGLAGGVSTALKSLKPEIRIYGVETVGADAMSQALAAGKPVELPAITSIAKTLGAPYVSEATLGLARSNLGSVTVVTDRQAVDAMVFIAERLKVITEPAAACTLAAAEQLVHTFPPDAKVVLIFCGGNTGVSDLCSYLTIS